MSTDDVIRTFEQTCLTTLNTGDQVCASSPFAVDPRTDSFIEMQINGVDVSLVFGSMVGGFAYFSNDGGSTSATKDECVQGTTLHWILGNFPLDATDDVRVRFEALTV